MFVDIEGRTAAREPGPLIGRGLDRPGAVGAYATHETLRHDAVDCRGNHVTGRAHIEQSTHGRDRIDGVQRREYQVTGHRTAQTDVHGFAVTHFAHQDDVRVLAQGGPQHAREVQ